ERLVHQELVFQGERQQGLTCLCFPDCDDVVLLPRRQVATAVTERQRGERPVPGRRVKHGQPPYFGELPEGHLVRARGKRQTPARRRENELRVSGLTRGHGQLGAANFLARKEVVKNDQSISALPNNYLGRGGAKCQGIVLTVCDEGPNLR